jgi:hypothetical protein
MKRAFWIVSFFPLITSALVLAENNADKLQPPLDKIKRRAEAPVKRVLTKDANRIPEAFVQPKTVDRTKDIVEAIPKAVLAVKSSPISAPEKARARVFAPKKKIEAPTERLVANNSSGGEFRNPKVKPGNVNWRADFDTACNASRTSGKPVLLFQMMGNLDDRFC